MLANLIGIPLTGLLVMPVGMAVLATGALPWPQVFEDAALPAMQFRIDALLDVTGWFAGLPSSPWRVAPPTPVLPSCLYGGMAVALCLDISSSARKPALADIAVLALAASLLSPPADGMYYARGKGGRLVLARPTGQADTISAGGRGVARSLSPYLADNAARVLAQPVHADGGPANGRPAGMRFHDRAAGGTLAIVTLRRWLMAGFRSGAAILVAAVRADYPCRDGTPIVSLSGLTTGN